MKTAPLKTSPDRMFRAFSDRTRLRILNLLRSGEICVCDIVDILGGGASQPLVSRHLAYLRRTGLVLARKQGLWIHYRLAPATSDFHKSLLLCLQSSVTAFPEFATDTKRLKANGCCNPSEDSNRCC